MKKKKIVLIGFACSYKSTVGKILSEKLGFRHFDTDAEIERIEKKSVSEIFSDDGESYFRAIEQSVLADLCDAQNAVISCGGGAVLAPEFAALAQRATVVWLTATAQTVSERLDGVTRPLFDGLPFEQLQAMVDVRSAVYRNYADMEVPTDNITSSQVANEVLAELNGFIFD